MWELTPPTKTICKMNAIQMCMVWGRKHNCRHPSPRLVWDEGSESPGAATNSLSSMAPMASAANSKNADLATIRVISEHATSPEPDEMWTCAPLPLYLRTWVPGPGIRERERGRTGARAGARRGRWSIGGGVSPHLQGIGGDEAQGATGCRARFGRPLEHPVTSD